ncbi:hypothetical protein GGX14DRAFT_392895 [Mycena pura]|uniref:Uncharacterized protein n=1 Tax=Mycena pura TaxID=153505 RepID=A0AAD6VJG1_9AGAR|nr:hypothetical protein GGX14DRAFT_392895 [Mycena pura]
MLAGDICLIRPVPPGIVFGPRPLWTRHPIHSDSDTAISAALPHTRLSTTLISPVMAIARHGMPLLTAITGDALERMSVAQIASDHNEEVNAPGMIERILSKCRRLLRMTGQGGGRDGRDGGGGGRRAGRAGIGGGRRAAGGGRWGGGGIGGGGKRSGQGGGASGMGSGWAPAGGTGGGRSGVSGGVGMDVGRQRAAGRDDVLEAQISSMLPVIAERHS